MKKTKSKIFFSVLISFIISVSSISPIFAECVSKERKERVKVGESCRTDSNGKERCKSIYELRVVAVETKCTDKIVINYYVHSDINGNVYMNGKQVGTNGKVTNMPINTDITGRMSEMGIDISTLEEALSKGTVNVVDARKSITNEQEYQESNIYKSNKSKTYEDWKKNLVSGNGVGNLDTSNLKVGKDGKITGTVDFSIKENDGINLKRISEYPDPHKAITEFVGKEHHTMAKAIDNIGSGKAKAQNVNFFSLTVPITREYEKKVENIPDEPKQDNKPQDGVLYGDVVGCPNYFLWSEIEYEERTSKERYYTDTKGKEYYYDKKSYIPHKYDYRIDFTTKVEITDAKNRNLATNSLKSGYGIKVATNTTYKISGGNGRSPKYTPTIEAPDIAYVMHDWEMTHIYKTQPKTTVLTSNGAWNFKTPVNKLSKTNSDVIYTDRDMVDGKHKIYVEIRNIKVQGRNLCTKNEASITIKGNMYEDYTVN